MTIGERLGITKFYDYFKSFGYLEKTGIDLPGEGNSVIKSQNDMTGLDLAIYAFGQNFNITPIQHMMAIAAVANGGYLMTPYLVEQITDNNGNVTYQHETEIKRQVISKDVCDKLAVILEDGVSGDGGGKNVYVAGYKIAAKTGTSEKKGTEIRVDNVEPYICSCVAFAPADDPEIAVLIMVDEPSRGVLYGSVIAAPYMGAIMEKVLPYIGVEKDVSMDNSVKVPYLMGMKLEDAVRQAEDYEYNIIIKGDGDYVTNQMPKGSTVIDRTNKVITLYTGDAKEELSVAVPDLVGKGAFAANQMLINAKLNICIEGTDNYLSGAGAIVIEQSIPAGTMVSPGTVVTVTFRYLDPDE
jgi:stage V sporulation protein D (sporulation-specific penicillin-binding protein)